MKRLVLVSEYLNSPYDEGIKKTVYQLFEYLNKHYKTRIICRIGDNNIPNLEQVRANRLFISQRVRKLIKSYEPDVIIYFPFASTTFASFIRHFVLSCYYPSAKSIILAMQPKPLKRWQRFIVGLIKPNIVLTPSPQLQSMLSEMNIQSKLIPLFTDLNKFKPISSIEIKNSLRAKYGINSGAYVISHMGHLNTGRNLKSLIPLQKAGYQVLIVASSSTPEDSKGPITLKENLEGEGILIIDRYIENIEEIYQLSDVYIFPVVEPNSSIGLPLSILEARACGIPVITTEFGSVKQYLGDDFGGVFYSDPQTFIDTLQKMKSLSVDSYQKSIVNQLNDNFVKSIVNTIES